MSEKVLGTNDGIENEKNLINAINGKRLCEIPSGPRAFLRDTKETVTDETEFVADSFLKSVKVSDFKLLNYEHDAPLKYPMAV